MSDTNKIAKLPDGSSQWVQDFELRDTDQITALFKIALQDGTVTARNIYVTGNLTSGNWGLNQDGTVFISSTLTAATISTIGIDVSSAATIQGVSIGSANPSVGDILKVTAPFTATFVAPPADFVAGGDLSGTSTSQTVEKVGGALAGDIHGAVVAVYAATPANTVSTIVERDGSGNFSAGTITANLSGNATTATTATTATAADGLKSATTTVAVSAATAPSAGQVLTASSSTVAAWSTPAVAGTRYLAHVNISQTTTNIVMNTLTFTPALPGGTTILPLVEVLVSNFSYTGIGGQTPGFSAVSVAGTPFVSGTQAAVNIYTGMAMTDALSLTASAGGTQSLAADFLIAVTI